MALDFVKANSILKEHCGEARDVSLVWWNMGKVSMGRSTGHGYVNVRIKTDACKGSARVELEMRDGQWEVVKARAFLQDGEFSLENQPLHK